METAVLFLLQAVAISLSGVMAPGPITAAALAAGTRSRHAGAQIALGHGLIEFPLMLLIVGGLGSLLEPQVVRGAIGLAGGGVLLFMGVRMLTAARTGHEATSVRSVGRPLWIGVILSAGNPYFLLWWATVGLTLVSRAVELGAVIFALFAVVHWLCDLVWLEALSLAGFRGSKLLSERNQRVVLSMCALALLLFGATFLHDAARRLLTPVA